MLHQDQHSACLFLILAWFVMVQQQMVHSPEFGSKLWYWGSQILGKVSGEWNRQQSVYHIIWTYSVVACKLHAHYWLLMGALTKNVFSLSFSHQFFLLFLLLEDSRYQIVILQNIKQNSSLIVNKYFFEEKIWRICSKHLLFWLLWSTDVEYEDPGGLQEKLERLNQVLFRVFFVLALMLTLRK